MDVGTDEHLLATLSALEKGQLQHRDACTALKKVCTRAFPVVADTTTKFALDVQGFFQLTKARYTSKWYKVTAGSINQKSITPTFRVQFMLVCDT